MRRSASSELTSTTPVWGAHRSLTSTLASARTGCSGRQSWMIATSTSISLPARRRCGAQTCTCRTFTTSRTRYSEMVETPTPAVVSFTVEWTADRRRRSLRQPDQQYRGDMRAATAQMEWTARSGIYEYTSAPLETSTTECCADRRGEQRFVLLSAFARLMLSPRSPRFLSLGRWLLIGL